MEFISIFDVIGPNMIGPSSSHTAGAASMALLARKIFQPQNPVFVRFTLYGSFAKTYKGHGTDKALLGGIMGFSPDDERIRDSFEIADQTGFKYEFIIDNETETDHSNTADIYMEDAEGYSFSVRGVSVGGGKIKLTKFNDIAVDFTGEYTALIVRQIDMPGVVAHITKCLADENVNLAFMDMFREEKGQTAYTVIQADDNVPYQALDEIKKHKYIETVKLVHI